MSEKTFVALKSEREHLAEERAVMLEQVREWIVTEKPFAAGVEINKTSNTPFAQREKAIVAKLLADDHYNDLVLKAVEMRWDLGIGHVVPGDGLPAEQRIRTAGKDVNVAIEKLVKNEMSGVKITPTPDDRLVPAVQTQLIKFLEEMGKDIPQFSRRT